MGARSADPLAVISPAPECMTGTHTQQVGDPYLDSLACEASVGKGQVET